MNFFVHLIFNIFMKEMDDLILDTETREFVEELMAKYPEAEIDMDKREDYEGEYLYLVGLMVKKKYRGTGIATKIIKDIFKHADENGYRVRAWACNVFGTDLRTWIPFLEKVGFQRVDNENNLIYYPKSSS